MQKANQHEHSQSILIRQDTGQGLRELPGLALVFNSFLVTRLFEYIETVAGFSAMIGEFIFGFPIVRVALKDLRGGSLNTNVLVAPAVLALFASGHYQEAGIVSFFMLLGQIIETRTAGTATCSARTTRAHSSAVASLSPSPR